MTRQYNNYEDMITFTRASTGTALRPVTYGTELVTNGTFDTDLSGWTLIGGSATVTNGEAVVSYDGDNGGLFQNVTVEVGKLYKLEGSMTAATSSGPRLKIGTTAFSSNIKQLNAVGNIDISFVATTTLISIFVQTLNDGSTTVDNISVKEVTFDQPDGTLTLFNHPNNVPRIEYDADGNWKGLLIEESRTNLLTYSEDFTDAAWNKNNTATLAIDATGPDGQTSAVTLVDSGATGTGTVYVLSSSVTVSTSTSYTMSAYLKADQLSWARLTVAAFTTPANVSAYFDLSNGVVGTAGTGLSATIEDAGNGWYRCAIEFTTDAADTTGQLGIALANGDNNPTVDLDGTSSILIYGAQLEAGAFPTSYIPTSGATATRSADVTSMSVSDFGYNVSKGTLLVEYTTFNTYTGAPYPRVVSLYESVSPRSGVEILDFNAVTNPSIYDGGTGVASFTFANNLGKYAFAFAENDAAACAGGGAVKADTSCTIPTPTTLYIGMYSSAAQLNGHIKSIQYYPRRLSNAQLQALTS